MFKAIKSVVVALCSVLLKGSSALERVANVADILAAEAENEAKGFSASRALEREAELKRLAKELKAA